MKKVITILLAMMFFCCVSAYSIDLAFKYSAKSGDKEFDATLGELNMQAKADTEGFISDLSISYNVPKTDVENLIYNIKMLPADAYMAIKIARLIRRPLDIVVTQYKVNRGKGWGVIAKELGIKPGSSAFHALKRGATIRLEKTKEKNKEKAEKEKIKSEKEKAKEKAKEKSGKPR